MLTARKTLSGKIVFLLLNAFWLKSCGIYEQSLDTKTSMEVKAEKHDDNAIIFLAFDVYKATAHRSDSLVLSDVTVTDGFLKRKLTQVPTIPTGKWRCSFLDASKTTLKSAVVEDPLIQHHEYLAGEGDKKKLENKIFYLDKSELTLRARYTNEMKYILLEKADSLGNPCARNIFNIQ